MEMQTEIVTVSCTYRVSHCDLFFWFISNPLSLALPITRRPASLSFRQLHIDQ
jgi:hypothetical protein